MTCVYDEALKVVLEAIVKSLLTVTAASGVFVLPFDSVKLLYAVPITVCGPEELYSTVLGTLVVTLSVPLFVNTPAMPKIAPVPMRKVLPPFIVTLYKLAVPDKLQVALIVVVPAEAVKDPERATDMFEDTV